MTHLKELVLGTLIAIAPLSGAHAQQQKEPYLQAFKEATKIEYVSDHPTDPVRYDYWQYPDETKKRGKGDCEDISFYLYDLLKEKKLNSKVVWGQYKKEGHMWVEYTHNGQTLILDPVSNTVFPKSQAKEKQYYYKAWAFQRRQVTQFMQDINKKRKNNHTPYRQTPPVVKPLFDIQ